MPTSTSTSTSASEPIPTDLNVTVVRGCLSSPPSRRDLPSGDHVVNFEVTCRPGGGPADTVPVAWFDAPTSAEKHAEGAEVVVLGRVRRRFFKVGGFTQSRTEVVADKVVSARRTAAAAALVDTAAAQLESG